MSLADKAIGDYSQVDSLTVRLTGSRSYSPDLTEEETAMMIEQTAAIEAAIANNNNRDEKSTGKETANEFVVDPSVSLETISTDLSKLEINILFANYLKRKFPDYVVHCYGLRFESRKDFKQQFESCVGILLVKKIGGIYQKVGVVIISNEKRLTTDENDDEEDNKSYAETLFDGGDMEFQEWCDNSGTLYYKLDYRHFQSYMNYVLNHLNLQTEAEATSSSASTSLHFSNILSSAEESGTEVDFTKVTDPYHPAALLGEEMQEHIKAKSVLEKKTVLGECSYYIVNEGDLMNSSKKRFFDFIQADVEKLETLFKDLHLPLLYHYNTYRGFTVSPRDQKSSYGFLAPSVLRSLDPTSSSAKSADIILLGIWRTRCNSPRIDIIIWDPALTSDKSVYMIKGNAGKFLSKRYCDLQAPFDVQTALSDYRNFIHVNGLIYDGVLPRDTKNPIAKKQELRIRQQLLAEQEKLEKDRLEAGKSRVLRAKEKKQTNSQEKEKTEKIQKKVDKVVKKNPPSNQNDQSAPRTRTRGSPLTVPKLPVVAIEPPKERTSSKRGRPPLPNERYPKRQAVDNKINGAFIPNRDAHLTSFALDLISRKASDSSDDELLLSPQSDSARSTLTPGTVCSSQGGGPSPGIAIDYGRLAREILQAQKEDLAKDSPPTETYVTPQRKSKSQQKVQQKVQQQENVSNEEIDSASGRSVDRKDAGRTKETEKVKGTTSQQQMLMAILPLLTSIFPTSNEDTETKDERTSRSTQIKQYFFS